MFCTQCFQCAVYQVLQFTKYFRCLFVENEQCRDLHHKPATNIIIYPRTLLWSQSKPVNGLSCVFVALSIYVQTFKFYTNQKHKNYVNQRICASVRERLRQKIRWSELIISVVLYIFRGPIHATVRVLLKSSTVLRNEITQKPPQ